jgi:hypothetical protein
MIPMVAYRPLVTVPQPRFTTFDFILFPLLPLAFQCTLF